MHPYFTTELGRMRAEEMQARATHYRLVQIAKRGAAAQKQGRPLSRAGAFVYRRALRLAALSVVSVAVAITVLLTA